VTVAVPSRYEDTYLMGCYTTLLVSEKTFSEVCVMFPFFMVCD